MELKNGQLLVSKADFNYALPNNQNLLIPAGSRAVIASTEPVILINILQPNPLGQGVVLRAHNKESVSQIFESNVAPQYDNNLIDWSVKVADIGMLIEGRVKLDVFYKDEKVGYFLKDIDNQTEFAIYNGHPDAALSLERVITSLRTTIQTLNIYKANCHHSEENLRGFTVSFLSQYLSKEYNFGAISFEGFLRLMDSSTTPTEVTTKKTMYS